MSRARRTGRIVLRRGVQMLLIMLTVSLLLFAIFIPAIVIAASTHSVAIIIAVILMFVLVIVIVSLIGSALNGIYTAAVYRFAAEGNAGTYFEAGLVENAFRAK